MELTEIEIEANLIAMEIILPEEKFKELAVKRNYSIDELSDYFECSKQIVRARAKNLDLAIEE